LQPNDPEKMPKNANWKKFQKSCILCDAKLSFTVLYSRAYKTVSSQLVPRTWSSEYPAQLAKDVKFKCCIVLYGTA